MKAKLIFLLLSTFLLSLFLTPKTGVNTLTLPLNESTTRMSRGPAGTNKYPIGCIESALMMNNDYDELGINFT